MNLKNLCIFTNNNYIISEHLRDIELYGYMDIVIDDINDRLQANFPSISEWKDYVADYNLKHTPIDPDDNTIEVLKPVGPCLNPYTTRYDIVEEEFTPLDPDVYSVIPARYLRSVVAIGAALNFFTNDEEGEQIAQKYYVQYERNMATMIRDFHELVPFEYQNNKGGYISNVYNGFERKCASIEGIVMDNGNYTDVF